MTQSLNYTPAALASLTFQAQSFDRMGARHSARGMRDIAHYLARSHKFLLPDNGLLLDVEPSRINTEIPLAMVRPPYPVTAAEYRVPPEIGGVGKQGIASYERIALILDLPPITDPSVLQWPASWIRALQEYDTPDFRSASGALGVISLYSLPHKEKGLTWHAGLGIAITPYIQEPAVRPEGPERRAMEEFRDEIQGTDQKTRYGGYRSTMIPLFPEVIKMLIAQQGSFRVEAAMRIDTSHELMAALNLGLMLHCRNVTTETMKAPAALNKKRERTGKKPLYDYHILNVSSPSGSRNTPGEGGTGKRLEPRQHFRRGHIRHLGDGYSKPFTWVSPALVGNPERGRVGKDYAIDDEATSLRTGGPH